MIYKKKIRNLVTHNTYGQCASFKFFGRVFLIPLRTFEDVLEAQWRIDVAASQLEKFFEEPYELLATWRDEDPKDVVQIDTLLGDHERESGRIDPMPLNDEAKDKFFEIPNNRGFRDFLHGLRAAQVKIEKHCVASGVDLSQVEIKRQQLLKSWPEVVKARKAQAAFVKVARFDGTVKAFENLALSPRNISFQLANCQKSLARLSHIPVSDRIGINSKITRLLTNLQKLGAEFNSLFADVKVAHSKTPVKD